jgi:hypothetical protein
VGVFDFDGGVVYEDADGQRHAAQGHYVDSFAESVKNGERSEDGER